MEEPDSQKILTLINNKISVKKDLGKALSTLNIDKLIEESINPNNIDNIDNLIENINSYEGKLKFSKKGIDFIYRYLGEKIRKKELNEKDLFTMLDLLNCLYSKSRQKILCLGGINVLLPIFEVLYKNNNFKTKEILSKLSSILINIFSDKSSIDLSEKTHFFSILSLFIEEYDENQIQIITKFIEKYPSIKSLFNKKDDFSYYENRKRYKKIKKKLFSFNGSYSNLDVFYNNNENKDFKYKIVHFLTKEMVCPFLKPILDMNLYKPKIKKFDSIFREDVSYSIDLDTFPVLEEKIPNNESFKCCLITITNHINGNLYFDKESLIFIESNFNDQNNFDFDELDEYKKTCYGNLIPSRSGKGYFKRIYFKDIYLILKRIYYFNKTACEIFTHLNKTFYFRFKTEHNNILFYNKIKEEMKNSNDYSIEYFLNQWKENNISNLEYIMWLNFFSNRSLRDITQYPVFPWILQKYELNQYLITNPEFRDFTLPIGLMELSERGKQRKKNYINFYKMMKEELPIPEKTIVNKIKNILTCIEDKIDYINMDYDKIPYVFGSHFSNPAYVSHYLTRLFPFTLTAIEIQGDTFDAPDRLFINLNKTFESVTSQNGDLKEIIPEFFVLPEMFININKLNLGKLQKNPKQNEKATAIILKKKRKLNDDADILVDEVLIPCEDDPYRFICEYRYLLEEKCDDIHKWFDLYFKKNQKKNDDKNYNIYMPYCYHPLIHEKIKQNKIPKDEIHNYYELFEIGFNPIPILEDSNGGKKKRHQNSFHQNITSNSTDSNSFDDEVKENVKYYTDSEIFIDKKFKDYYIYGVDTGSLFIYKKEKLHKMIQDHSDKIIDIYINDILNLFASISLDGYINIYTLPQCEILSSFKENISQNTKIYLSARPLPCVILLRDKQFSSYTIYGDIITGSSSDEIKDLITENFMDYLITYNNQKFPVPYFDQNKRNNNLIQNSGSKLYQPRYESRNKKKKKKKNE